MKDKKDEIARIIPKNSPLLPEPGPPPDWIFEALHMSTDNWMETLRLRKNGQGK